jgi:AbrB family looped-hinge helix DNA binding protein
MSSKGQVVIPADIRKQLRLKAGSQFVVLGKDDVVILRAISPPAMGEFDSLIAAARKGARQAGMKRSDVAGAIARVRGRR